MHDRRQSAAELGPGNVVPLAAVGHHGCRQRYQRASASEAGGSEHAIVEETTLDPFHSECLEHTGGDGDADSDKDQATDEFAPVPGPGAESAAKLQAEQGQGDTDGADHDGRDGKVDVKGAEREADREIVDAQRCPVISSRPVRGPASAAGASPSWPALPRMACTTA